jgi:hypothetical protein
MLGRVTKDIVIVIHAGSIVNVEPKTSQQHPGYFLPLDLSTNVRVLVNSQGKRGTITSAHRVELSPEHIQILDNLEALAACKV